MGLARLGRIETEKYLKDSNEHVRTWAIRLLFNDQPMDGLFGPREKDLPTGNANLEKKRGPGEKR